MSAPAADGGAFRRFVNDAASGGPDSGLLAEVAIGFNPHKFKNATTNAPATAAEIVAGTNVTVTAAAGDFAVGTDKGGLIASNKKPWRVSSAKTCTDGALTLGAESGTLDTYASDPEGDLKKGDLTPAGIAAATRATGSTPAAMGTSYFCVNVKGNTDPIREIGDAETKGAYQLTATTILKDAAKRPVKPAASGPHPAGAIDRNGTTVHIPYLSTHDAYNQRLVLVNRGSDAAQFWVDNSSFNLEAGVTLVDNLLQGAIPAEGRLVLRVQDNVTLTGKTRAAATINIAAPTRNIDVMTIQVHPGTGQIDTTVYQHE